MRKLIIVAAAFMCLSGSAAFAQETSVEKETFDNYKNEFNVSYGIITVPEIAHAATAFFGTFVTLGTVNYRDLDFSGAFTLSYFRYLHPMFGVGGEASVETCRYAFEQYNFSSHEYDLGETRHSVYVSVMPAVKGRWIRTPHFCLYSKVAVGSCFVNIGEYYDKDGTYHPSDSDVWVAFQVTPAGVEFGGEKHRGFFETGLGMQGTIRAGYRFAF